MIKANEISNIIRVVEMVNMGVGIACIYGFNHEVTSRESVEFEENIALNNFGIDLTVPIQIKVLLKTRAPIV